MDIKLRELNRELQRIRQFLQEGGRLNDEERRMLKSSLQMLLDELDLHLNEGESEGKSH